MDSSELRKTLSEMTDSELQEVLLTIRQNRRTQPTRAAQSTKKKSEAKPKSELNLASLMSAAKADPSMKAKLLAALLEDKT